MEKVVDTRTISYEEWLNYRRSGIGGSDVGAIIGVNPYGSKAEVYFDKVGEINASPDTQETSEAMYWGTRLEDIIADEFQRRTNKKVEKNHYILRSKKYPFMLANLDRVLTGRNEGLECKTSNVFNKSSWEDDNIPESYMAQVQHYMAVTGYEGWWVAVLIGGNNFQCQYIERDEEYIENLIKLESDFWFNHVQMNVVPDLDGSSASSNLIKRMFPKAEPKTSISLNGETNEIINKYMEYSENEKEFSGLKEECVNKIKMMLGDNEKGATDSYVINWKNVNSSRFNSQTFKKDHPDLFKQYSKASSYRRFSIK